MCAEAFDDDDDVVDVVVDMDIVSAAIISLSLSRWCASHVCCFADLCFGVGRSCAVLECSLWARCRIQR